MPADADLEIGFRWDRERDALFANLRFAIDGTDYWEQPPEPVLIDVEKLRRLTANEQAYGEAMTEMVLGSSDVGQFYRRAVDMSDSKEQTLHLRFHINAPLQYHALRWESLRDPRDGQPIATQSNILVSRYLSSPDFRPITVPARHELKALLVVAGPSDVETFSPGGRNLAPVQIDDELDRGRAALAEFHDITELAHGRATLTEILSALNRGVDVVYLVCHGALHDDVPLIVLEGEGGKADVVDGRKLVERLLALERRPTVAMLSSCQSAGAGNERRSDDNGELAALGPRLAAAGVSAVVAMQGNVSMTTAGIFAPAFFKALATHGVVDRAVAAARRELRDRSDWWVPILFSRLRSGRTYYRPAFAERGDSTWETLRLLVPGGNFTPVLGPGLADSILGSRQDMARGFVERWQMPLARHSQGDLAQVAQYLRVRSAIGTVRAQLFEHLSNEIAKRSENAKAGDPFFDLPLDPEQPEASIVEVGRRIRESDPGDPYRVVAAMPARVYVTTAWTDLLQDALRQADPPREPVTLSFPWNDPVAAPTEFLDEPTMERPLVYHLFGRFEDPRSLVLTEEDYFAWFEAWLTRRLHLPPVVRTALVEKSLLFLGFRLDDWDFRVIFHALKTFGGSALLRGENLHVGVQLSPENQLIEPEAAQEYLESYFGNDKVSIYWGETRRFLDELRERTGLQT